MPPTSAARPSALTPTLPAQTITWTDLRPQDLWDDLPHVPVGE